MGSPLARIRFSRDHRWSQAHMSEYVDAELAARECKRIERHTRDCSECRDLLMSLQEMVSALAKLDSPEESVAASVLAGVRLRLAQGDGKRA